MEALLQQQQAAEAAVATLRIQLEAAQRELQQHTRYSVAAHTAALARSEALLATMGLLCRQQCRHRLV
jgi:hypothetical protein